MLEAVLEHRVESQRIASILILLAMLRWGGAPERLLGLAFVVLFTVPMVAMDFVTSGSVMLSNRGVVVVISDVLACIAFVWIALNANRNYTLWIAGFQVVATSAHVVRPMLDVVTPLAYATMAIGPSWFQLALMTGGLVFHVRRKKRYGEYRDWRISPQQPWNLVQSSSGPRGGI